MNLGYRQSQLIVKEKSVEELNAQLVSLVGENRANMLISAFKSRRRISGPELAGRLYKLGTFIPSRDVSSREHY